MREDPQQAAVWLQKAAALGDAASKSTVGALLLDGDERAGVTKDAARGFELVRQAFAQGFRPAMFNVARCYLSGNGVEKDAATGQGLTLVHCSAQRKRFPRDRGGIQRLSRGCLRGDRGYLRGV